MIYSEMFNEYKKYVDVSNEKLSNYIIENNIDENDGMHIWFEFVITPFMINAIENNDINVLKKSFEFVEMCLKSNDKDITEVIEFSLLEGIVAEIGPRIEDMDIYFGEETVKSINSIKKYIFSN